MTTVAELWRFPVKSMAGEQVATLPFDRRGPRGDRLWSVRDVERASTLSARRLPALLTCAARYAGPVGADAGPGAAPPVVLTLPDGTEVGSDDRDVHARLSAALDRDVRLVALTDERRDFRLPWRERLRALSPTVMTQDFGVGPDERLPAFGRLDARAALSTFVYATPPGSFVDLSPVHVVTEASLDSLREHLGDAEPPAARRFRPNVVLAAAGSGLPESGWTGATIGLGTDTRLRVSMPTVRCVVPSRAQRDVELDRRMTRAVAAVGGRYLGCYADVVRAGEVAVGDGVVVDVPEPPGRVTRALAEARRAGVDGAVRLVDVVGRAGRRGHARA